MQLYLLRHADADTPAESDEARALSRKGLAQAKSVAKFLADREIRPALVLTSPVRRARETAGFVDAEASVAPWLACGLEPAVALEKIASLRQYASILIVGHEPDFSRFAAYLLGLPSPTALHVRKASLTLIDIDLFKPKAARLEFSIPCKLM
jgi:phosphohistidine phosphatase